MFSFDLLLNNITVLQMVVCAIHLLYVTSFSIIPLVYIFNSTICINNIFRIE